DKLFRKCHIQLNQLWFLMQCSLISSYYHDFTEERTMMLKLFPDDDLGSTTHDRKKEQEKGIHMTPIVMMPSISMLALSESGNVFVLAVDTSRVGITVTLMQDAAPSHCHPLIYHRPALGIALPMPLLPFSPPSIVVQPLLTDLHHYLALLTLHPFFLPCSCRRPPSPFLLQRCIGRCLPCSQPQPPLGTPHADATASSLSSPWPSPCRCCSRCPAMSSLLGSPAAAVSPPCHRRRPSLPMLLFLSSSSSSPSNSHCHLPSQPQLPPSAAPAPSFLYRCNRRNLLLGRALLYHRGHLCSSSTLLMTPLPPLLPLPPSLP
ncbi:hypothetical protein BHM03_00030811, partial [Ensete ventricosum]